MSIGVVISSGFFGAFTEGVARSDFAQPPQNLSSARFTNWQALQPPGRQPPQPPQWRRHGSFSRRQVEHVIGMI